MAEFTYLPYLYTGAIAELAKAEEPAQLQPSVKVQKYYEANLNIADIAGIFNQNETIKNNDLPQITPDKFGVLGHIDPTRNALIDALHSIKSLRDQLKDKNYFLVKAKELVDEVKGRNDIEDLGISPSYWTDFPSSEKDLATVFYQEKVGESFVDKTLNLKSISDLDSFDKRPEIASSIYSSALFSTGNTVRTEVRNIDNLHNVLLGLQKQLHSALSRKKNELAKLDDEIPIKQRQLSNLNQQRIKALGEAKMVLALVEENWREVERAYVRRENILNNHRGLYFVRVNETPYAHSLPFDDVLRYGRLEDLVPAMAISYDEMPDDIEPYIEAVIDIPIANLKALNSGWNSLPSRNTIIKLMEARKSRLNMLTQRTRTFTSAKFLPMFNIHQSLMQDYARFQVTTESSLQALYRQAVSILSLEDLLTGPTHPLRGEAQTIRNRFDQATHALLAKLQTVKPSIRLEWATAAELDQLDLRNPQSWPGMDNAKVDDLNTIRTFMELVHWWWRQLNDDATSAAVTAVRNLLRAALMVAVGDDPKEMIHGYLQSIPNQFRLGDILRAKLNRHAPIGTLLQLINEKDELVGQLRVDDADQHGSLVSVVQLHKAQIDINSSQFSLIGSKTLMRSFV